MRLLLPAYCRPFLTITFLIGLPFSLPRFEAPLWRIAARQPTSRRRWRRALASPSTRCSVGSATAAAWSSAVWCPRTRRRRRRPPTHCLIRFPVVTLASGSSRPSRAPRESTRRPRRPQRKIAYGTRAQRPLRPYRHARANAPTHWSTCLTRSRQRTGEQCRAC